MSKNSMQLKERGKWNQVSPPPVACVLGKLPWISEEDKEPDSWDLIRLSPDRTKIKSYDSPVEPEYVKLNEELPPGTYQLQAVNAGQFGEMRWKEEIGADPADEAIERAQQAERQARRAVEQRNDSEQTSKRPVEEAFANQIEAAIDSEQYEKAALLAEEYKALKQQEQAAGDLLDQVDLEDNSVDLTTALALQGGQALTSGDNAALRNAGRNLRHITEGYREAGDTLDEARETVSGLRALAEVQHDHSTDENSETMDELNERERKPADIDSGPSTIDDLTEKSGEETEPNSDTFVEASTKDQQTQTEQKSDTEDGSSDPTSTSESNPSPSDVAEVL